jgi:hypothetical protein
VLIEMKVLLDVHIVQQKTQEASQHPVVKHIFKVSTSGVLTTKQASMSGMPRGLLKVQ